MEETSFHLVVDGSEDANFHMEKDRRLLKELTSASFLRIYRWKTVSVTYGYFIDPWTHINAASCKRLLIEPVKRPTGGGVLFHDQDIPFSLFIPKSYKNYLLNINENYRLINSAVLNCVQKISKNSDISLNEEESGFHPFCLARPITYDIIMGNKKIGGGAIRKTSLGLLYQGSISLTKPSWDIFKQLVIDDISFDLMKEKSGALFSEKISEKEYEDLRGLFTKHLYSELLSVVTI